MRQALRTLPWVNGSSLVGSLLCLGCTLLGCAAPPNSKPGHAVARSTQVDFVAQARRRYEQAIFFKPREDTAVSISPEMAPLIIQEVAGAAEEWQDGARFGAVLFGSDGEVRIDPDLPTIYVSTGTTVLAGRQHEQVVFQWWYPPEARFNDSAHPVTRGLRMTLDEEGYPTAWEVLSDIPGVDRVFVSGSLERAAAEAFGPPLPERQNAIERGSDESPRTVVPRVLDDGPMPMGPFVYLGADRSQVTTLLCRCMPSQVDLIVETVYYDLRPLEELSLWGATPDTRGGLSPSDHSNRTDREPLDRRLRWPGAKYGE